MRDYSKIFRRPLPIRLHVRMVAVVPSPVFLSPSCMCMQYSPLYIQYIHDTSWLCWCAIQAHHDQNDVLTRICEFPDVKYH